MLEDTPTEGSVVMSKSGRRRLALASHAFNRGCSVFCELFPDLVEAGSAAEARLRTREGGDGDGCLCDCGCFSVWRRWLTKQNGAPTPATITMPMSESVETPDMQLLPGGGESQKGATDGDVHGPTQSYTTPTD